MNIIYDVAQFNLAPKLIKETLKLIVTKMMEEKCADHNIIFSFQELFTKNINSIKLDMWTVGHILFCKCNYIWIGIKPNKLQLQIFSFTPRVNYS